MGSALMRGLLEKGLVKPSRLMVSDPDRRKLMSLRRTWRFLPARSNRDLADRSDGILLAVKPQQMEGVLTEIRPHLTRRPLLISIAAGIPTGWIEDRVGRSIPVVRVMPNTPALVQAGICAIAPGWVASPKDVRWVERIFACLGEVVRVPEGWMNAVTAVSGSGPAYFFFLMEQMIQAGVALGLPAGMARRLVLQTAIGAAKLAAVSKEDPGALRLRVTSRGGTTEEAFRVFHRSRLGPTIQTGIRAAARRARELAGAR
jgi:pyrroline-5-carboxylate reductase